MTAAESALVAALIGATAALIVVLLREWLQILREYGSRNAAARASRAERLRELYIEVLTAAIQATPAALQYRPSGKPSVLSPETADRLRARLSLEAVEDGQAVLTAFIGVVNFSGLYLGEAESRATDPDRVPLKDLRATEQFVRDNMAKLEEACRSRLADLAT